MVDLTKIKNIYLYPDTVNFRIGIPGLSNLILTFYKKSEIQNSLFIFFGRDKRQIKMIEISTDGVWLYQKRLFKGDFILPRVEKGKVKIEKKQLIRILTIIKGKKNKK